MQIGIVGLPLTGKSSLFQTITKTHLDPSSMIKVETHQAIIKVPDERLDKLTEIFNPKKKTNATIEVFDVVGLQKGESGSTQFTSNFLGKVKNNDALIQVVRLFNSDIVPHPDGSVNMMRDIDAFETEFIFSDLAILEKRIDTVKKQSLKGGQKIQDDKLKRELLLLEKCFRILQEEKPLRDAHLSADELKILNSFQLLTAKPMLIALNLDETQVKESVEFLDELAKKKLSSSTKALCFFGKIEQELSELPDNEAQIFMNEYGIEESALYSIIKEAYDLLGLQSFFTCGEQECRAWTIKKESTAQQAAGEIHTDFFNRFIRAEVVGYDDFLIAGTFAKAKEQGTWRLEGKEYIVKDGDILIIRHG